MAAQKNKSRHHRGRQDQQPDEDARQLARRAAGQQRLDDIGVHLATGHLRTLVAREAARIRRQVRILQAGRVVRRDDHYLAGQRFDIR